MKKIAINETSNIVYVFMILSECVHFEHIEDKKYILQNINIAKENLYSLPKELRIDVEKYIDKIINPILYNMDYFSFMNKSEYGEYDDEGNFVINSEESLDMLIYELYNLTIELHVELLKIFAKYIK